MHLAVILLKLHHERELRDALDRRGQALPEGPGQDELFDQSAEHDQEVATLEAEARQAIYNATGVPWDVIERASL